MATDNTPPRLKLIVTIAVITIVTLIGLDFVFRGYMAFMNDMAVREKAAPPADLLAQHAAEKALFAKAKLPLDQAIAQVSKGARPESISPRPSDDTGAMVGWSKLPRALPSAPQAPAHTLDGPGDAGAPEMMASDAGAALATDAGAPAVPAHAVTPAPPTGVDAGPAGHLDHGKVHTDGGNVGH